MQTGDIEYILTTFWRVLEANPGRLLPVLAYACAITLVIAVVTDGLLRRRPAREKIADEKRNSIPR
jgi:hypothetical protein